MKNEMVIPTNAMATFVESTLKISFETVAEAEKALPLLKGNANKYSAVYAFIKKHYKHYRVLELNRNHEEIYFLISHEPKPATITIKELKAQASKRSVLAEYIDAVLAIEGIEGIGYRG